MRVDTINGPSPRFARGSALITTFGLVALILFSGTFSAKAGPGTPRNFRVTQRTAYTVSLAWDPANNNSGTFTYRIWGAYNTGPTVILPQNATSYTFQGLFPGNTYWFGLYAQSANGQTSAQVTTSTTTLADTTPPSTAPAVMTFELGSNYASLAWTAAQDDGPYLFYEVFINGSLYSTTERNVRSMVVRFLQPQTTYTATVRAYDYGYNRGPLSDKIRFTTLPPNPNDHTPPTTPTSLQAYSFSAGDTELQFSWAQSTDAFDAQANIRYDVYVNGVAEEIRFGSGGPVIVYGQFGENTIQVIASDTAGNASAPATTIVTIQ